MLLMEVVSFDHPDVMREAPVLSQKCLQASFPPWDCGLGAIQTRITMLLFKEEFLNFVGNLKVSCFVLYYFSASFGEILEESYKSTKAILFIHLDCIEEPVILPSIDHLFFLHVSRSSWFLTEEYIFLFFYLSSFLYLSHRD